jgi:hypothetical protein
VIDYSRCTNCMECIDFCLFGVYGIDHQETILVEQPDNCRRGCPACSRVCPAHAIIFPQHKTPAIAGDASAQSTAAKLDLSPLLGGTISQPTAEQERAAHLAAEPAAAADPQQPEPDAAQPTGTDQSTGDQLDSLVDELDRLDL